LRRPTLSSYLPSVFILQTTNKHTPLLNKPTPEAYIYSCSKKGEDDATHQELLVAGSRWLSSKPWLTNDMLLKGVNEM